ncbi:hypothetical protein EHP00_1811 [Ecytonucleospora hepatopenaei]|uniref:Smr domain-containing protein n=1 Tax=Ecytonucleospora hepatopenaei TaxID=646526 RepID=A0A1W0E712_9MICR|nr:hypothetical protein EHP00_1811 [Ecytonucleospora hepatopenaei]
MTPEEIRNILKEMFNWLTQEDLDFLSNSGEEINTLITRVLDNNYKPITLDIKDIEIVKKEPIQYKKELHYPEVFDKCYKSTFTNGLIDKIDDNIIVDIRNQAKSINQEAIECIEKGHKNREFTTEYLIKADTLKEEANRLNREAAILIMKLSLRNRKTEKECVFYRKHKSKTQNMSLIDLHGLYKNEALMFVEDLYTVYNFTEINFVTGQKTKNRTLRPVLEEWFEKNGFVHYDLGAIIKGKKK